MLKDILGKKYKLVVKPVDNVNRYCQPDYRVTVSSIATDIQNFLVAYLEEPNNGYAKEELSVSVSITDGSRTLYSLTALRIRETMETKNVYMNRLTFNLARGKYPVTVRIGIYVKNRNKGGIDRASHLFNAIERSLKNKHKNGNA